MSIFNHAALIGGSFPAHQAAGIEWLREHPRAVLADAPGLGKTIQGLGLIAWLAETQGIPKELVGRVLIAAPASLLAQWASEIKRFLPGLSYSVHTSESLRSKKRASELTDIELVSFSALPTNSDGFQAKRFATVILDEASGLKSGNRQHAAVMAVTESASRIVVLTATPMENDLCEFYEIMRLLRLTDVPGSYTRWCNRYVIFKDGHGPFSPSPRPIGVNPRNLNELHSLVDPYKLRRSAEDAGLPIPTCERSTALVPLLPLQERAYERAAAIGHPTIRSHKLTDACNLVGDQSAKVEYAIGLLESDANLRAIVRCERLDLLELMSRRLDLAGISYVRLEGATAKDDRTELAAQFRADPSIRVCLGSRVLERGLNLQVCDTLISLGSSWVPAREIQAEGRIARIGSPFASVRHITIVTDTSYEAYKHAKVDGKRVDVAAVLRDDLEPENGAILDDLADEFLAGNEGWTASDIQHLLTDRSKTAGQLRGELLALIA